jgi:cbb3-type cytochrome c oxidase subunit III
MDTFWTVWVITQVLLAMLTMYYVVGHYFNKRNTENYDRVLNTIDGIEEHDGPVPKIIWAAYFIGLLMALAYFLYMPALGGFKGFGDFQADDVVNVDYYKTLDEQIAELNPGDPVDLTRLAKNSALVASGKRVFQNSCVACHRQNAQGQVMFPNLADTDWLNGSSDAQILHSISKGRKRIMPPWGSILQDEQINDITDYLVSLNKERLPFGSRVDISGGRALFMKNCVICHGSDATGKQDIGAPDLSDDIWLFGGDKKMIFKSIKYGLDGTMPAFETRLTHSELIAVAAYIKHLATKAIENGAIENKAYREAENTLLKKGQYLARIGDCVACHTASKGGEPLTGGLAFKLPPMGTIHSTNISQHADSGIGSYTYDEFHDVMRKGKGKQGYLYPAMPYTSFKYVKDEDIKAIWAYLKSINPRARKNEKNTGLFSLNLRFPLALWSKMFRGDDVLDYDNSHSKPWNRGKYLVLGLAHCSECHTPRNMAQAMDWGSAFKGNLIDGWQAPDISANMLFRQGWTAAELAGFLNHGYSDKGTVFAGMAEVISNSTRFLTPADAQAMATYLIEGDELIGNVIDPDAAQIVHSGLTNDAFADKSYKLFTETCGACHGVKGEGRQDIAPDLNGNSVFSLDDHYNTVAVVLRGLDPDYLSHDGDMPMTRFDNSISDARLAKLISFVRNYFGGQHKPVTEADVTTIRMKLEEGGFTPEFHKKTNITERPESM